MTKRNTSIMAASTPAIQMTNQHTGFDFRELKLSRHRKMTVRSQLTGQPEKIKVRPLTEAEKRRLSSAWAFIEFRLADETQKQVVLGAMKLACFISTPSKHIGAYTGWVTWTTPNAPLIFINARIFKDPNLEEFAVTVLHELLHVLERDTASDDDKEPDSLDEARHDLETYGLLGLGVPANHWAFEKYPELLEEMADEPRS